MGTLIFLIHLIFIVPFVIFHNKDYFVASLSFVHLVWKRDPMLLRTSGDSLSELIPPSFLALTRPSDFRNGRIETGVELAVADIAVVVIDSIINVSTLYVR